MDVITGIPTYEWETYLTAHGYTAIAGVDEVGRGALAGPLMAGAVILPDVDTIVKDIIFWSAVRDSKTLSFKTRSLLAEEICFRAQAWALGTVEADELDAIGVAAANRTAMERAVYALHTDADYLLIDATTIDTGLPQQGIIDGDALSLSIAAASIIAKVARDEIMIALHDTFPRYGFARHKGYAAKTHREAIMRYGPCPVHRFCYAPVRAAATRQQEREHAG
jgi:ribonuclease HII